VRAVVCADMKWTASVEQACHASGESGSGGGGVAADGLPPQAPLLVVSVIQLPFTHARWMSHSRTRPWLAMLMSHSLNVRVSSPSSCCPEPSTTSNPPPTPHQHQIAAGTLLVHPTATVAD